MRYDRILKDVVMCAQKEYLHGVGIAKVNTGLASWNICAIPVWVNSSDCGLMPDYPLLVCHILDTAIIGLYMHTHVHIEHVQVVVNIGTVFSM